MKCSISLDVTDNETPAGHIADVDLTEGQAVGLKRALAGTSYSLITPEKKETKKATSKDKSK